MESVSRVFDLSGKAAVVTGGAAGIGRSIAERLAEAGASVLVADVNGSAASGTAAELQKAGSRVEAVTADVSNVADIRKMVDECVERFGSVDILVNNAGVFPFASAESMTEEQWDHVLDINLKGTFFCSQAAAKVMREKGGGKIINIASIDALHPAGSLAHYDASKGGVLMMTRSLALEWAVHGIYVNAILPGAISTPGVASQSQAAMTSGVTLEQMLESFTARIPLKRMGEPDDIAKVALFLASSASSYMTGSQIVVDGGFLLS
ncbi:MAG: SDR family NAD(P)-dependent oxidoreductase [Dehalococcoidia bacterium]